MNKFLILSFLFLMSCNSQKKECFYLKNGRLIVNCENINTIDLISKDSIRQQTIELNENKQVKRVNSKINLSWEKDYVNTWVRLNKNGCVVEEESYSFESFVAIYSKSKYLNVQLKNILVTKGKYFLLTGRFDEKFLASKKSLDTTYFNDEGFIEIKITDKNSVGDLIRFIIVEQDTVINEQRVTHGEHSLR